MLSFLVSSLVSSKEIRNQLSTMQRPSQTENFRSLCRRHKNRLLSVLTERENDWTCIHSLTTNFLLIALQELPPNQRLEALSSFAEFENDSVYQWDFQGRDKIEKYRVRRSLLHVLVQYYRDTFIQVFSLLPTEKDKLNALMLRDNHGETVFYRLCINDHFLSNLELAFRLLQEFTLDNQQKILTQRSLNTYKFVDDPYIINNPKYWNSNEQFPLYFFLKTPDKLASLLNCFSTEALRAFLNIYAFQRCRLLEYAVSYPESLKRMLQKLGHVSCEQDFKNESWSVLRYVTDVAIFDVLDCFFTPQEIQGLLLQGGVDYPNDHALFSTLNTLFSLQKSNLYSEKVHEEYKILLHRMLSYFELDEERMVLINKQSFYGYTLLYHNALLSDNSLCKTLLAWVPRKYLLGILTDEIAFHHFLERKIKDHRYAFVKEHASFGLILAHDHELLAYAFDLLPAEDRPIFLQHLLTNPNLICVSSDDFDQENEQARLTVLKKQVITSYKLTEPYPIINTVLNWIPSSIVSEKISNQYSNYQAIINATTIASLQDECTKRLALVTDQINYCISRK